MLVIYILIIYNIEAYKNKGDNMKRISIFIREDQKKELDKLATSSGTSCSELIRESIDTRLFTNKKIASKSEILKETNGFLKNRFRKDIKSTKIIENLRSDWEKRYDRHKR